jgi:membrane-bound lytic murein transglycosylase MltF
MMEKRYFQNPKFVKNAASEAEIKKFRQLAELFRKYGDQYDMDYLLMAAQGFQESGLDQSVKSPVGAIGVMQVMPATGKELAVGDISVTESNIHAGSKYMDQLMTRYFADAKFSPQNRTLFAFASYNAGPGNIAKMRKEAAKRGLDPDKWFNNVETVTAEKIGMEPTTYVRNIFKYYVSYKLEEDARENVEKLKQQAVPR